MAQPYQPLTPIPQVTPATTPKQVSDWFYYRRSQVEALAKSLTIKSDIGPELMSALGNKLRTMEGQLRNNTPPTPSWQHATTGVVAGFKSWLGNYEDHGAWDFYAAEQTRLDLAEWPQA